MNKKSLLTIIFVFSLAYPLVNVYSSALEDPAGKWNFTASSAPYGYNKGVIEINKDQDGYKTSISFDGLDYSFDLDKVMFRENKLTCSLYLEGEDISIVLTYDAQEDILSGKAIYSMGEVPLSANRKKE